MNHFSRWVPIEPTDEMLSAAHAAALNQFDLKTAYKMMWAAMLNAAPPFVADSSEAPPRRAEFAPQILAALLRSPHTNDATLVAHAVSLSDMLARAITTQPVDPK